MLQAAITNNKQVLDNSKLPKGVYVVQIAYDITGAKELRKLIKE